MNSPSTAEPPIITAHADDGFQSWLSQANGVVAISTYQAGKLALVGWNGQQTTLLLRQFDKPMGMALQGSRLALATRHEVLLFADAPLLAPDYLEGQPGCYDALYLPRAAYFTGRLDIHDMAWDEEHLWIVNTRFSCLSTLSPDVSFVPRWQPRFISDLVPEDRCHLNGLTLVEGKPGYVTALGATNRAGGWRDDRVTGGVVIEVDSGEPIVWGLAMPHSPVWHHETLWLLNSGAGELLRIDPQTGETVVVCRLPGFLRGLCCIGHYALVGLSQLRDHEQCMSGLPVQEYYERLRCGVAVIDLRKGAAVGFLEFQTGCHELYGVQFLAGVSRPMLLHPQQPACQQALVAPNFAYWLRPRPPLPTYTPL